MAGRGEACFTRGGTGWNGLCCAVHACVSLTRDKEAICGKDCTGCPPASWNPSSKSPNSASSSPSSKSSKSSPKPASPSSSPSASASYSSMAPASTGGGSGGLSDGGLTELEVRDLVSDSCAEGEVGERGRVPETSPSSSAEAAPESGMWTTRSGWASAG